MHAITCADVIQGLKGCGIEIGYGLTRYGLGDQLLHRVYDNPDLDTLPTALSDWRTSLRHHLQNDPSKYIEHRHPALARAVHDDFPQPAVLSHYVRPITHGGDTIPLDNEFGRAARFDLACLAKLCDKYFSWDGDKLESELQKHIWPGVILRLLAAEQHDLPFAEHQINEKVCRII